MSDGYANGPYVPYRVNVPDESSSAREILEFLDKNWPDLGDRPSSPPVRYLRLLWEAERREAVQRREKSVSYEEWKRRAEKAEAALERLSRKYEGADVAESVLRYPPVPTRF